MEDIFTQEIKDLMKLATIDFDKFYKETDTKFKSSGNSSTAASSGNSSTAASSGNFSKAASSGYYSKAASSGNFSTAASSGNYSTAASSGDYSKAASSGNYSTAASSGDYSTAASSGDSSACSALGFRAAVKGDVGNLIMASEYKKNNGKYIPVGGKADIVDGKKLKASCWYIVEENKWVEVDFSDGIFSRIISTKGNIKKCKSELGNVIYVISEDGLNAHGDTIKSAQSELAFKRASKDVDQFRGMPLTTEKSPEDWGIIYRAITGACSYGVGKFISENSTKKKYSLEEILQKTKGAFRHEEFKDIVTSKGKTK